MRKKVFIKFSILVIGILINLATSLSNVYISLPTIIATNILGTTLVASFTGSLWGGIAGGLSSLIWIYYGNGLDYIMIFAIMPMLTGIIAGLKCSKNLFVRVFQRTTGLVLIIPLIGYFISTIYFKTDLDLFSKEFISFISLKYTNDFQKLFWSRLLTYGFSCLVAELVANIFNKEEFENEI